MDLTLDSIPVKSENVVFRKIENEYILVPIVASAADVDSIFNLNETGAVVWERIDGIKKLSDIVEDIKAEYESEGKKIEDDVMAFVNEMIDAKLIEV
jgi:hypothetical protein